MSVFCAFVSVRTYVLCFPEYMNEYSPLRFWIEQALVFFFFSRKYPQNQPLAPHFRYQLFSLSEQPSMPNIEKDSISSGNNCIPTPQKHSLPPSFWSVFWVRDKPTPMGWEKCWSVPSLHFLARNWSQICFHQVQARKKHGTVATRKWTSCLDGGVGALVELGTGMLGKQR